MKNLLVVLVVVLVVVAGYWFFTQNSDSSLAETRDRVRNSASNTVQTLKDNFDADTIKDELARTGKVIREKSAKAGDAIADATANARITGAIKAGLVKDSGLAAFKIDVDTTDGVVTLSGTVSSHDEIARAMKLAYDTDGVRTVVSTLQVKPNQTGS